MRNLFWAMLAVLAAATSTAGQDVRGLEVCTAEKAMERRTSCLQSNVEFLQQVLAKQARDTQAKLSAAAQEVAAQKVEIATQRAEIAALKIELTKLQQELVELKKAKPGKK